MQAAKDQSMSKAMRDAYENFQKSPEADTIGMKKGGKACYASGGYVRAADGIASKGKTKGKQVKM